MWDLYLLNTVDESDPSKACSAPDVDGPKDLHKNTFSSSITLCRSACPPPAAWLLMLHDTALACMHFSVLGPVTRRSRTR